MVNLYIVAGRQSPESQKPGFFFVLSTCIDSRWKRNHSKKNFEVILNPFFSVVEQDSFH